LGQWIRRTAIALGLIAAVVIAVFLTDRFETLVDRLMARLGAVRTLALLGVVTLALGAMWLRNGGARVGRGWGIVVKPAQPAAETANREPTPLVGPRK